MRSIKQLINERYHEAKAVFWGGSVSQKIGTKHSDLDLVIIFENRPHAYREAFFMTIGQLMHLFMIYKL